jgi:hypothetical protein
MSNFNQVGKDLPYAVSTDYDSEPVFSTSLEPNDSLNTETSNYSGVPLGYPASYSMDMMGTEEIDIDKILEEIFGTSTNPPMPTPIEPQENLFTEYSEGYIDYPPTTPKPFPPFYPPTTPKPFPPFYPPDNTTNNFLDGINQIIASFATGTPILDFLSNSIEKIKPIILDAKENILSISEEIIDTVGNISQNLATGTPILDFASNVVEEAFGLTSTIVKKIKGGIIGGIKGFFKGIEES